jgi:hypothetical protein
MVVIVITGGHHPIHTITGMAVGAHQSVANKPGLHERSSVDFDSTNVLLGVNLKCS